VHFVGRLATYKYYNMDQVVAQALTLYKKITEKVEEDKTIAEIEKIVIKGKSSLNGSSIKLSSNGAH
ncbi:MAG: hypothetical protein ACO1OF_11490, partial [Adhaeribacter sp.]